MKHSKSNRFYLSALSICVALTAISNAASAQTTTNTGTEVVVPDQTAAQAQPPSASTEGSVVDLTTKKPIVPAIGQVAPSGQKSQIGEAQFPIAPISLMDKGTSALPLNTKGSVAGVQGGVGKVLFPYGHSQPKVSCAPLHICVINLMAGERVNNINLGDTARWLPEVIKVGDREAVSLKPIDTGLSTNLVISTNQGRLYYIDLESNSKNYQPQVGFFDPAEISVIRRNQEEREQNRRESPGVDPAKLDFNYSCNADSSAASDLLPKQVFAGNGHTYLQMQPDIQYKDAPAIFNMSSGTSELINSRFDPAKGYFIVDGQPNEIKLVIGNQDGVRSVTCTHNTSSGWFRSSSRY